MANCSSQRAVSRAAPRQRVVRWTRILAGRKRDEGNEESLREAEGWEGLSRHSPHAILHTPLSVLYSTLLHYAGTAYKRRVVPTPEPPDANRHMSIRLLVVLAVCNSDKHYPERGGSVIEWEKYAALCRPLHNPHQTSPEYILWPIWGQLFVYEIQT